MKTYKMKCPYCNADLLFALDEAQMECKFCKSIVNREISEEDQLIIQKEKQVKEIRTVLDNRMQLSILENKRNELSEEMSKAQKSSFQMPVYSRNKDKLKFQILGMCSPVLLLAIALMCIIGEKFVSFFFFLILTMVSIPLAKKLLDKYREEKVEINAKTAEAQTEQELFQTNRDRQIYELKEKEKEMDAQIRLFSGDRNVGFLSREYQNDNALRFLLDKLSGSQDISLQEAIYLYDEKRQKDKQRMLDQQREQLKITANLQREQMQIQQEMLRTQQEQLRVEQQQQLNRMPFQQPAQMVQQVTVVNHAPTPTGKATVMNHEPPKKCPQCGSKHTWNKCDETREGVNVGAAVVGGLFLGPLGLLAGAVGHTVEEYHCTKCGLTRRYKH